MPLAVICGLTLGSFEKSESSVMWMESLLVFVMPFNYHATESTALFRDLTRAAGVF